MSAGLIILLAACFLYEWRKRGLGYAVWDLVSILPFFGAYYFLVGDPYQVEEWTAALGITALMILAQIRGKVYEAVR